MAIEAIAATALNALNTLGFFRNQRMVASFTPLVIQESIEDPTEITEHPIEDGSVIADHVIKKPITATMDVYFEGSNLKEQYEQLLALQTSAQPFTVVFGKRSLDNMLLKSVRQVTDVDSEYVLHLTLSLQQIMRVTLQEVAVKTPAGQQAGTQNTGKIAASAESNAADAAGAAETAGKNSSALYDLVY